MVVVKEKNIIKVEDALLAAELSWDRVKENISKGQFNRDEASLAMNALNNAAKWALKTEKRHLLKETE